MYSCRLKIKKAIPLLYLDSKGKNWYKGYSWASKDKEKQKDEKSFLQKAVRHELPVLD